jgi:hypothetical protein
MSSASAKALPFPRTLTPKLSTLTAESIQKPKAVHLEEKASITRTRDFTEDDTVIELRPVSSMASLSELRPPLSPQAYRRRLAAVTVVCVLMIAIGALAGYFNHSS